MAIVDLLRELIAGLGALLLFPLRILLSVRSTKARRNQFINLDHSPPPADPTLSNNSPSNIFISCGDISGENHALQLVKQIHAHSPATIFSGFGGERLTDQGMNVWEKLADLNVMGFVDVAKQLPLFISCIYKFAKEIRRQKPDVVVLIDYPGLNQRLLRICHRQRIPVVNFIAPQLWAWAAWRICDFKKADALLTILPFENDWYQQHGAAPKYVGHPLGDGLAQAGHGEDELPPEIINHHQTQWVGLLPGSRKSEIERNLPIMLNAATLLKSNQPQIKFIIPHLRENLWPRIKELVKDSKLEVFFAPNCFHKAIPVLSAAMVTSGTASLEVAAHNIPNIVVYAINSPYKEWLARRVVAVPWAGSLNLIAGKEIAPEHIGGNISAQKMADDIAKLLSSDGREKFHEDLAPLKSHFCQPGCSARVSMQVINAARR